MIEKTHVVSKVLLNSLFRLITWQVVKRSVYKDNKA